MSYWIIREANQSPRSQSLSCSDGEPLLRIRRYRREDNVFLGLSLQYASSRSFREWHQLAQRSHCPEQDRMRGSAPARRCPLHTAQRTQCSARPPASLSYLLLNNALQAVAWGTFLLDLFRVDIGSWAWLGQRQRFREGVADVLMSSPSAFLSFWSCLC